MHMRRAAALAASIVLSFSTLNLVPAHAWNQSTFGALALTGSGGDVVYGSAIDSSGNIFMAGYLTGYMDADPSPTSDATLTSAGGSDVFVTKYNSNGEYIWAKKFGSTSNDYAYGIDVDSAGNVYITGTFQNTVDFDPGAGTYTMTSYGSDDDFFLKLSTDGNFVWAKQIGTVDDDRSIAITIDSNDNVLATGFFRNTTDFNPARLETSSVVGNYAPDVFILKLSSSGTFIWAKGVGSTGEDMGHAITTDSVGNVYVTGKFKASVDFDPGAGTATLTGTSTDGVFVLKLDSNGAFGFAKSFHGTGYDVGQAIEVAADGSVYTTGYFESVVDFDPGAGVSNLTSAGNKEAFVSKLDSNGNYVWAKSFGSTGYDEGTGLAIDSSGNLYVTGGFTGTTDFDPGAGTYNLTVADYGDAFALKLTSAGAFIWADAFTGGPYRLPFVELTPTNYLIVGGVFNGVIDFNPSLATTLTYYPSTNFQYIFLVRLAPDGTLSPATLIDKAIFTSVGISGGGIVATYRTATTLSASVNVAAKVSFLSNGKYVAGCRNLIATGSGTNYTATCSWKPAARGSALISAVAVPTGAGISSGVSTPVNLVVANRTTKR